MKCNILIADNQFILNVIKASKNGSPEFERIFQLIFNKLKFFMQMDIKLVTLIHAFLEEQKNLIP